MSHRKADHRSITTDDLFAGCHVPASVAVAKRAIDIAAALIGLLVTAPLWPLLIALNHGRPLLSRQMRIGRVLANQTELFMLLTLTTGTGRVGAMLRWARIDELPQLLNLLRGDVSLVGPRAETPSFYARLDKIEPLFADRMIGLRPGLTGLSPAGRSDADIVAKAALDATYAQDLARVGSWLRKDAQILFRAAWQRRI